MGTKRESNNSLTKKVNQPLHNYLSDPVELYLPGKEADRWAKKFRYIPNHQMRKVLDSVKEAKLYAQNGDLEKAKKQIFIIVVMCAYNSGREPKKLFILYDFVQSMINEQSIKSEKDIYAFDEFFTSIVAYHYHKQYSK